MLIPDGCQADQPVNSRGGLGGFARNAGHESSGGHRMPVLILSLWSTQFREAVGRRH